MERSLGKLGTAGSSINWNSQFFYRGQKMKDFYIYEQQINKLKENGLII